MVLIFNDQTTRMCLIWHHFYADAHTHSLTKWQNIHFLQIKLRNLFLYILNCNHRKKTHCSQMFCQYRAALCDSSYLSHWWANRCRSARLVYSGLTLIKATVLIMKAQRPSTGPPHRLTLLAVWALLLLWALLAAGSRVETTGNQTLNQRKALNCTQSL